MADIKYREHTKIIYSHQAGETFEAYLEPPDLALIGDCPNCKHEMRHHEPLFEVGGIDLESVASSDDINRATWDSLESANMLPQKGHKDFTVYCQCNYDHSDAPKSEKGCGAYWQMNAKWER